MVQELLPLGTNEDWQQAIEVAASAGNREIINLIHNEKGTPANFDAYINAARRVIS